MALFITTHGFFGRFAVIPKRIKAFGANGEPLYSDSLVLRLTRTGVNPQTAKPEGILDTDHLPYTEEEKAKKIFGKDWRMKLDAKIDEIGKVLGLKRVTKVEIQSVTPKESAGGTVITNTRTVASRSPEGPRRGAKQKG